VDVLAGADSLTAASEHEDKTKADVGIPNPQRLGCHTGVIGPGVRVRITNVLGEELIDP
jgi:ferredoxin